MFHGLQPAVANCSECGGGLCSVCFEKVARDGNKPICFTCLKKIAQQRVDVYEKMVGEADTQKTFWTIALVIGALLIITALAIGKGAPALLLFLGLFVWAIPGAFDRLDREEERLANQSKKEAVREAIQNERDGFIGMIVHFFIKLIVWTIRGCFFPIFYFRFVFFTTKEIQKELEEAKKDLEIVGQKAEEVKSIKFS